MNRHTNSIFPENVSFKLLKQIISLVLQQILCTCIYFKILYIYFLCYFSQGVLFLFYVYNS